jgi:prepilin-type N-terminal cleavage/methylation domain-containing protein
LSNSLRTVSRRLASEESGFTLIEMLIVVILLGIVTALAFPTYLSFQDRGKKTAAASRIRIAADSLNAYALNNFAGAPTANDPDWNGTDAAGTGTNADNGYADTWSGTGHDVISLLKAKYDSSLSTKYVWNHNYTPTSSTDFCIYISVGPWYAAKKGPGGDITTGKLMTENTCTAS